MSYAQGGIVHGDQIRLPLLPGSGGKGHIGYDEGIICRYGCLVPALEWCLGYHLNYDRGYLRHPHSLRSVTGVSENTGVRQQGSHEQ